jgi:large subunit ribosomal protein L29
MTAQETRDLREHTAEQLAADLESAHHALFNLRFQSATRQLADVSQVSKAKRRVARLRTLQRERAILAEIDRATAGGGE